MLDLQVNGFGGIDYNNSNLDPEDFEKSLEQANKSIASGKTRTKNLVSKVEKMRTIGGLEPTKDISDKLRVIDKE